MRPIVRIVAVLLSSAACTFAATILLAQANPFPHLPPTPTPPLEADRKNLPGDLRAVPVPAPTNLGDFVKNGESFDPSILDRTTKRLGPVRSEDDPHSRKENVRPTQRRMPVTRPRTGHIVQCGRYET
jgi:hypothetical protein